MGFEADWLDLREPADARARDAALLARAAGRVAQGGTVVDLGCGTGASLRAFAARDRPDLDWRLVDNDRTLLAGAAARHPQATTYPRDLRDVDALPLDGAHLVTASALLDLVSEDWLARLTARLARAGIAFYAALSYDGVMRWHPADPDDAAVTGAFNDHQRGDKGLGPALGPDAGETAARLWRAQGYEVALAPSPWRLGPKETALQAALLSGVAQAATEAGCAEADGWLARRRAPSADLAAEIGHVDLLATPRSEAGHG